jgi:hypothetical protein
MFQALQVITILLVAVLVAATLAHVLELPGKMRLPKAAYLAVQQIYYPGFTIAGLVGEFGGMLATLLLTIVTPAGPRFWLTLCALVALVCVHAIYWLLTHPVNRFWVDDFELKGFGKQFFHFDPAGRSRAQPPDWTALRDRWEYSHVMRAALAFVSLALLATAATLGK